MSRRQLSNQRYKNAPRNCTICPTDPFIGGAGPCNLKSNYEAVPGKSSTAKNYVAAVPIGGPRGQAAASSAAASSAAAASTGAASSGAASSGAASSGAASSGAANSGAASSGAASSTGGM
jgi:hypothetical protein